ncbi:MAG: sugar phosphate isomerase/epimerase [Ruminococcaceae bacterium]|nr:sugar phosphate isomerase/epimerase [Oscillospiraceae bacterium]
MNSIHLPFVPPSEVDLKQSYGEIYNNTIKIYTELIKASANAGIKYAVIHSGLGVKPEQDRNEVYNIVCSNLKKLCEISKEAGIKLAIENLKPAAIGGTKEEIYSLINEIDDLGVCFDTNHSLCQTNEDFIRLIKDRIVTLHVSDYDFVDEQHWLPLCGKINWKSIINELKKVGYDGIFTYEVPSKDSVTVAEIKENYIKLMNL